MLTRKELSDRWQLSIETLKRRERCGLLRFLKLGKGSGIGSPMSKHSNTLRRFAEEFSNFAHVEQNSAKASGSSALQPNGRN